MDLLQRKVAELEARPGQPPAQPHAEEEDGEPTPPQPAPVPPPAPNTDATTLWAVREAISRAGTRFQASHPDATEHQEEMLKHLAASGYNAARVIETNDPAFADAETTRALEDAYYRVRTERQAALRKSLEAKRADQLASLSKAKKTATISGSGSSAPPPSKPKSTDDMTVDELDAALQQDTGGRW